MLKFSLSKTGLIIAAITLNLVIQVTEAKAAEPTIIRHFLTQSNEQEHQYTELKTPLIPTQSKAHQSSKRKMYINPQRPYGDFNGTPANTTTYPNSAIGIVYSYYHETGARGQCTGSVINTLKGTEVLTAAHCVIDEETGQFADSVQFIPGYARKKAIYGIWEAQSFVASQSPTSLTSYVSPSSDMAILSLRKQHGRSIKEVTGALGIKFNQPISEAYIQYGYPAESPYLGDTLYALNTPALNEQYCLGLLKCTLGLQSALTKGSSGGPWVVNAPVNPTVASLNSKTFSPEEFNQPVLKQGPYFGMLAQDLYVSAGGSELGADAYKVRPRPFANVNGKINIKVIKTKYNWKRNRTILLVHTTQVGDLKVNSSQRRFPNRLSVYRSANLLDYKIVITPSAQGYKKLARHSLDKEFGGGYVSLTLDLLMPDIDVGVSQNILLLVKK